MNAEKLSGSTEMTDAALAADLLRQVAGPPRCGETVKAQILRALRRLQGRDRRWSARRVKALWYGEGARIEHREINDLRALTAMRAARREHAELTETLARLETMLAAQDAAFHRTTIDALRSIRRGVDRA